MEITSNVNANVETEIKERAEVALKQLGIPMSSAGGMLLREVIIQKVILETCGF